MLLEASCHCGCVTFNLKSAHPYPYNYCYCSICRKTQGGGGYAINLSGNAATLNVSGSEFISLYQVRLKKKKGETPELSPMERRFCMKCGSGLWCWDPRWPELIHPFASAIDTPLPKPPEVTHLMTGSKANWVALHPQSVDKAFSEYPEESIAAWHQRLGLEC